MSSRKVLNLAPSKRVGILLSAMQPLGLSAPGAYGDLAAPPARNPGLQGAVHSVLSSLGAFLATSFLYESAAGAQQARKCDVDQMYLDACVECKPIT